MDRRKFLVSLAGGLVSMLIPARSQPAAKPTIGFLRSTPSAPFGHLVDAFRRGLSEAGFVEGQNVAIQYRWADNQLERLPALAAELVRFPVDVIVGNSLAAEAAKGVTAAIPIVFVTSDDPLERGLVRSMSRPDGNLTGITFFGSGQLGAKRLELLAELVPRVSVIAFLMDPTWPASKAELRDAQEVAAATQRQLLVVRAATASELAEAFATMVQAGARALLVGGSPFFTGQRRQLVALAARHGLPAMYDVRDYVAVGGLMSYGASFTGAYRHAGVYTGRILKGAKPSEMPVLQPTTFELVLNLTTAKALGLTIPQSVLIRADELIQ